MEQMIADLYTKGWTSKQISLKGMDVWIKTLTADEAEIFNLLLSKAIEKLGNNVNENLFSMLYLKWNLLFMIQKIKTSRGEIDTQPIRNDLQVAYESLYKVSTNSEKIDEKIEMMFEKAYEVVERLMKAIPAFVLDKISEEYKALVAEVQEAISDLKN